MLLRKSRRRRPGSPTRSAKAAGTARRSAKPASRDAGPTLNPLASQEAIITHQINFIFPHHRRCLPAARRQ